MDLITLALAKKYTNKKFSEAVGFGGFKIVDTLPTTDISTSTIYLLKLTNGTEQNLYEEFVYIDGQWESLGMTTDVKDMQAEIDAINKRIDDLLKVNSWGTF